MIYKRRKSHSFKTDGTSPKRKSPRSPKRKSPRSPKRKSPQKRVEDIYDDLLEKFRKKIQEVVKMKEEFLNIIEEVNSDYEESLKKGMEQIMEDELCKYTLCEERTESYRGEKVRLITKADDSYDIDDDKFYPLGKLMTVDGLKDHDCCR